jgi:hypothetical protein
MPSAVESISVVSIYTPIRGVTRVGCGHVNRELTDNGEAVLKTQHNSGREFKLGKTVA